MGSNPSFGTVYTIQIKAGGNWFKTIFKATSLKFTLIYASERAAEIGEENVRILLDNKEFL